MVLTSLLEMVPSKEHKPSSSEGPLSRMDGQSQAGYRSETKTSLWRCKSKSYAALVSMCYAYASTLCYFEARRNTKATSSHLLSAPHLRTIQPIAAIRFCQHDGVQKDALTCKQRPKTKSYVLLMMYFESPSAMQLVGVSGEGILCGPSASEIPPTRLFVSSQ